MDTNKLKKLREIKYQLCECCFFCKHAKFNIGAYHGTCQKHQYKHMKHTGTPRQMSIMHFGKCKDDFEFVPEDALEIICYGGWIEFAKGI